MKLLPVATYLLSFFICNCNSFENFKINIRDPSQSQLAVAAKDPPRADKERLQKSLLSSVSVALSSLSLASVSVARDDAVSGIGSFRPSPRPLVYSVEMTDPPCLQPRTAKGEISAAKRLAKADFVLFGEHRESGEDKALAASILTRMLANGAGKRRIALGLDIVDTTKQASLDSYLLNTVATPEADAALVDACGEDIRGYLQLLHIAREQKMRLLALGVPNQIRNKIADNGLKSLTPEEKSIYIADPDGFINLTRDPGFTVYTDKVIITGYEAGVVSGAIPGSVTAEKYFASRIFEDEALACSIARRSVDDETIVVVMNGDAVKFGFGVEERLRRNIIRKRSENGAEGKADVVSVLLNPTAKDSLSPTVQLQLALGYGKFLKDQRPLAEYIWFSDYPPVKILTRTKNPISAEGEKPAGESSIIGAF
jgi:hypothetical protein